MSPKEWSRQGKDFITVLAIACNFKLVDGSGIFCYIFILQRTVGTGFEKTKTTHRKETGVARLCGVELCRIKM